MRAKINKSIAIGEIKAPPSKSYAHRYLISGALSRNSKISNVSFSNDIKATLSCLRSLGFIYIVDNDTVKFLGYEPKNDVLDCLESGSTLRFFIPLVLALNKEGKLTGTEKLFSRGLDTYLDIFDKQNISYSLDKNSISVKGELKPGRFDIKVDKSSQYISGLLFALPLLNGDSEIHLLGKIESKNYIDITIEVLRNFGIDIKINNDVIYIKGNQNYIHKNITIEGDYSNSAFLEALNYLGGNVKINGLNPKSLQGDKAYLEYYPILKESHPVIDLSNSIDLGPILFTMSAIFNGAIFKNIERLRIKESDRVKDLLDVLELYGTKYSLKDNEVEIFKSELHEINNVPLLPNDHRIVMAISILLTKLGGEISGVEAINKSYPNFYSDLKKLNVEVEIYDE